VIIFWWHPNLQIDANTIDKFVLYLKEIASRTSLVNSDNPGAPSFLVLVIKEMAYFLHNSFSLHSKHKL